MNPEEIPPFTGELPEEIADKTGELHSPLLSGALLSRRALAPLRRSAKLRCIASAACSDAALGVGSGRTILLAQLTVNRGTTFTGHVNVQGRRPDGGSWQEHGVCFSIGKGCTKHPRHDEV